MVSTANRLQFTVLKTRSIASWQRIIDARTSIYKMSSAIRLIRNLILLLFVIVTLTFAAEPQPLIYSVLEEQDIGTVVANVLQDAHIFRTQARSSRKALLLANATSFRFVRNQTNFVIDAQTGIIRTAVVLDRDTICPRKRDCRLDVDVAVHQKKVPSTSLIKVLFDLIDINDNAPTFPKPHVSEKVSELSPRDLRFPIQPAVDPDSPANGVARYELVSDGDTFRLIVGSDDDPDLQLILQEQLDRETKDFYQLKVVAFDGGFPPKSGSVLIHITVDDVNDNGPVFGNTTYRIEIGENTPPQPSLLAVRATDRDVGKNGVVNYAFSPLTAAQYGSNFSVDAETGVIALLEPVDYERASYFVLTVVAQDGGESPIPATARVSIEVKDANDNTPEIRLENIGVQSGTQSHPVIYVKENCPKNTFVAALAVSDADSGANGRVRCSLTSPQFRLEQMGDKEFKILTGDGTIDREYLDRHELIVTCYDSGLPVRSSSLNVLVIVDDENDNKPRFKEDVYNFSIEENNSMNVSIGRVSANDRDKDRNGDVDYHLEPRVRGLFSVDPKSGLIRALIVFDRERNASVRFHVYARDSGPERWSSSATVSVNIIDNDDEGPRFVEDRYVFYVSENVSSQTRVGQLLARDLDQPPFNRFTFYLDTRHPPHQQQTPSNSSESLEVPFGIQPSSGVIYTRQPLNRRRRSSYDFTAVVQSDTAPRRTDTTHVFIHVREPAAAIHVETGASNGHHRPPAFSFWRLGFGRVGLAVLIGGVTGCLLLIVLVCVAIVTASRRRRKTTTSQSTDASRNCSFWSNPDALTPPPVVAGHSNGKGGGGGGDKTNGDDVLYNGGSRQTPSSVADDVSDEDFLPPANGHSIQTTSGMQCHWCSSTDLDIPPAPPSYEHQLTLPRDHRRGQTLGGGGGACGFRPIGGGASSELHRVTTTASTPPIDCRRQLPLFNNNSPLQMAHMYTIKNNNSPGRSTTLDRRTVRFHDNPDNDDFRRLYGGEPSVVMPTMYPSGVDGLDFPPPLPL